MDNVSGDMACTGVNLEVEDVGVENDEGGMINGKRCRAKFLEIVFGVLVVG